MQGGFVCGNGSPKVWLLAGAAASTEKYNITPSGCPTSVGDLFGFPHLVSGLYYVCFLMILTLPPFRYHDDSVQGGTTHPQSAFPDFPLESVVSELSLYAGAHTSIWITDRMHRS